MGVKSTVELTRAEAVNRLSSLYFDAYLETVSRTLRDGIEKMSNETIENELERLNDQRCGGEGFDNYLITDRR